jgi:hypothetical protein
VCISYRCFVIICIDRQTGGLGGGGVLSWSCALHFCKVCFGKPYDVRGTLKKMTGITCTFDMGEYAYSHKTDMGDRYCL